MFNNFDYSKHLRVEQEQRMEQVAMGPNKNREWNN
jgi:hypothetical protein